MRSTENVDPKALFILETDRYRLVIGRALLVPVITMVGGSLVMAVLMPRFLHWLGL